MTCIDIYNALDYTLHLVIIWCDYAIRLTRCFNFTNKEIAFVLHRQNLAAAHHSSTTRKSIWLVI